LGHPVYIAAVLNNQKSICIPEGSPFINQLPWVPWVLCVFGAAYPPPPPLPPGPFGPGWREIPHWLAKYLFVGPCHLALGNAPDLAAFANVSAYSFVMGPLWWSQYLSALHAAGLFAGGIIDSPEDLPERLLKAVARLPDPPAAIPGNPAPPPKANSIGTLDLLATHVEPLVIVLPGGGVRPYPTDCDFVNAVSLADLYTPTSLLPLGRAVYLGAILTDCFHAAPRHAQGAPHMLGVYTIGRLLVNTVLRDNRAGAQRDMDMSRRLPTVIGSALNDVPIFMRMQHVTHSEVLHDFDQRVLYHYGRRDEKARIECDYVFNFGREAPLVGRLLSLYSTKSDACSYLRRYVNLLMHERSSQLYAEGLLSDLQHVLQRSYSETLLPLLASNSSPDMIYEAVSALHQANGAGFAARPGNSTGLSGPDATGPSDSSLPNLSRESLQLAINSPKFAQAAAAINSLDLDDMGNQLLAIGIAYKSGSALLIRYLDFAEQRLEPKHAVFGRLKACLYLRGKYFAVAIASGCSADGQVPKLLKDYELGKAELQLRNQEAASSHATSKSGVRWSTGVRHNFEFWLAGEYARVDWVNAPGGFLEHRRLAEKMSAAETYPYSTGLVTLPKLPAVPWVLVVSCVFVVVPPSRP